MTSFTSSWLKNGRMARTMGLACATPLIFGSAMLAGVAVAASDAPRVMDRPMGGWHGMMGWPGAMSERMEERLFERLDTDGNGEISRAEIEAAREARRQRLAEMDTDKDGRISREERRAFFAKQIDARQTEAFARADTDGSGGIGLDEYQARAAERAAKRFARLDRDGDGQLVLEEFKRQHMPRRHTR